MYRPLPLFVGLRYIRARKRSQLVSFVSLISMLGIALGVLVMIAVLSVINASTTVMRDEMLKSIPHASLRVPEAFHDEGRLDGQWLDTVLGQEGVEGAAPYRQGEAWLQFRNAADFVQIRGIDPSLEVSLKSDGTLRLHQALTSLQEVPEGIVPGSALAGRLGLFPDERLDLTALDALTSRDGERTRSFRVLDVTDLGFYGNRDTALVSLAAAGRLFEGDRAAAELRLQLRMEEPLQTAAVLERLLAELPPADYDPVTWDQSQASLFNALRMEKRMTAFMLLMIVIIGAVNIVSTLVMVVADKRADIAILRTMGASRAGIMAIFVTQGMGAGLLGTMTGVLLGVTLTGQMDAITSGFDALINRWLAPDSVYMISHLRAELLWSDVWLVAGGALLISLLATLYPAWRASRVEAADVLRYE
ncbi:MAG: FtsX-like permease family protein [Pseudohongiellaceae bacterium]